MGYSIAKSFFDFGSWVPTYTGFSVDPTIVIRYLKVWKLCFMWGTTTVNGTGNLTTASGTTMTIPYTSDSASSQNIICTRITNGGTNATVPGMITIAASSNIATIFRDSSATTTWTASGNKGFSFWIIYHTA